MSQDIGASKRVLLGNPEVLEGSFYMGGCQSCDPFLGTLNIRCRIIIGIQKGIIILTTTHMVAPENPPDITQLLAQLVQLILCR